MSRGRTVVVSSTGLATPAGIGVENYLKALKTGEYCIKGIDGIAGKFSAGQVPIGREDSVTRIAQLSRFAWSEALASGGEIPRGNRLGVVFASAISATLEIEECYVRESRQKAGVVRFGSITDDISTSIGAGGPRFTISTGCVAGLDALGVAHDQIVLGKADAMLVVAAEATLSPIVFAAFDRIGALSRQRLPIRASQPFGLARDGFVLSEAAAAVLLESSESAESRSAEPIAELMAWESVSSAYHMTNMRTDGSDLSRLVRSLVLRAGVETRNIDLVDLHGTSTGINDLSESNAMLELFPNMEQRPRFVAQKATIGHSLGASNLVEIVGLSWMLRDQFVAISPTANLVDVTLQVPLAQNAKIDWPVSVAVKISSSFSGIHTAALLRRIQVGGGLPDGGPGVRSNCLI